MFCFKYQKRFLENIGNNIGHYIGIYFEFHDKWFLHFSHVLIENQAKFRLSWQEGDSSLIYIPSQKINFLMQPPHTTQPENHWKLHTDRRQLQIDMDHLLMS